jgi:hypothetical protein
VRCTLPLIGNYDRGGWDVKKFDQHLSSLGHVQAINYKEMAEANRCE